MANTTHSLSVLVADDHPDTADSLAALLEVAATVELDTVVVYDGMQAVQAAAARTFDVVILDVDMPGLDGLAAGRAITQLRPREQPVLIAVSGHPSRIEEAAATPLFAAAFRKPVDSSRLLKVIFGPQTRDSGANGLA